MPNAYFHQMFGDAARALQIRAGSRASYARREDPAPWTQDLLTERELSFLAARDSLYVGSVTTDGWPYIQHRGGPPGFVRALGDNRVGFADYPGNRQFISRGNLTEDGRVALFAMDYAARRRLKLIGQARIVTAYGDPDLVERVSHPEAPRADAAFLIDVAGFDWNCPQFIEPRFTRADIAREVSPLLAENASLRAELARLKGDAA